MSKKDECQAVLTLGEYLRGGESGYTFYCCLEAGHKGKHSSSIDHRWGTTTKHSYVLGQPDIKERYTEYHEIKWWRKKGFIHQGEEGER